MEEIKNMSLSSTFSVNNEVKDEDTRFLNVTIDVLHTGENYNKSIFEKDIVDECVESIKNTPILGFVKIDRTTGESDFNGHEYIITKTDNEYEEKYIGHAFGVIPESCNPRWITKECDDGVEREFLQVDALMWNKFDDSISILNRDIEKSESMELDVNSVEGFLDDDEIFHFTKFKFDGCCLLGDGIEPAMANAMVSVKFSMDDFNKSVQEELNNKFKKFSKLIDEQDSKKGVETMPEETKTPEMDFAQTVNQQMEDLSEMVCKKAKYTDRWGDEYPRYYLVDVQDSEVIMRDHSDYHYYACSFVVNGDKPEIDFETIKRMKISYVPYEEGEQVVEEQFSLKEHVEEVENRVAAKFESENENLKDEVANLEEEKANLENEKSEVEANYTKLTEENEAMKAKYQKYVDEENERLNAELAEKKNAEFSKYDEVLGEVPEFISLKEQVGELSVEDIESKCAVLFTRQVLSKGKFSKENSTILSSKLIHNDDEDEKGYVPKVYGNIPLKK